MTGAAARAAALTVASEPLASAVCPSAMAFR